jgi:hypothetical protein
MELGRSERTSHGVEPTPLIESRVDWMLDGAKWPRAETRSPVNTCVRPPTAPQGADATSTRIAEACAGVYKMAWVCPDRVGS